MIYVCIDIAKQKHFAATMATDGEALVPSISFSNDAEGFNTFLSKIKSFDKPDVFISLESTAHYGEDLVPFLFDLGYQISVINLIQTSVLRKTNIRKSKTYKIDCMLITKSMIVNKTRFYSKADIDSLRLKSFCRFREKLKKSKDRLKTQLVAYVDVISPELQYSFKSMLHTFNEASFSR